MLAVHYGTVHRDHLRHDTLRTAALLAVRVLTLLEPLLVLVVLIALPVDRALHVVVNMLNEGIDV